MHTSMSYGMSFDDEGAKQYIPGIYRYHLSVQYTMYTSIYCTSVQKVYIPVWDIFDKKIVENQIARRIFSHLFILFVLMSV